MEEVFVAELRQVPKVQKARKLVEVHRQNCGRSSRAEDVKSTPPTTENWPRKLYNYSVNNDTSTEDKHETNHINNEYNDMNMNTRKMHNT